MSVNTGQFRVTVDDTGLIKALDRLTNEVQNVILDYLKEEAMLWQRDIRKQISANGSVDTGTLKKSVLTKRKSKWEFFVGTSLFYAPYVEFGTRESERRPFSIAPKPFIQPVYDRNKDRFKDTVTRLLREALS